MGVLTWLKKCCGSDESVNPVEKDLTPPVPIELSRKSPSTDSRVIGGSKCLDTHVSQVPLSDNVRVDKDHREHESEVAKSLWDRAYDSLDPALVDKYEKLLSARLQTPSEYLM